MAASEDTKVRRVRLAVMFAKEIVQGVPLIEIGLVNRGGPIGIPLSLAGHVQNGAGKTTKKQIEQSKPIVFRGGQ